MNPPTSFFKMIAFCFLISCAYMIAMKEEKNESFPFMRNLAIGSIAGATEVGLSGQPLTFIKNTLQQMEKPAELSHKDKVKYVLKHFAKQPRSQFYRGIGVNTICMVPTTAVQIGLSEKLKDAIPGEGVSPSFLRNGTAGALGALVGNPSELIIVNQQNWKTKPTETIQCLYTKNGPAVALRGYSAKALRENIFCSGFLTAYPLVKDYIEEKTDNPTVATILSTACVGPVTAVVSHPFDTISTRMQADASQEKVKGILSAAQTIYKEGGIKKFFSGFTPRTTRILVAIPLISAVKESLSKEK